MFLLIKRIFILKDSSIALDEKKFSVFFWRQLLLSLRQSFSSLLIKCQCIFLDVYKELFSRVINELIRLGLIIIVLLKIFLYFSFYIILLYYNTLLINLRVLKCYRLEIDSLTIVLRSVKL